MIPGLNVPVVARKLDAFCGTKNTNTDFGRGFVPDPTGAAYTAPQTP